MSQVLGSGWDKLLVFDMAASQEEIDAAVGSHVPRPDLQRLVVYLRNGRIVRTVTETQGFERPIPGELIFQQTPQVQNHIVIVPSDQYVYAAYFRKDVGTYEAMSFLPPGYRLM